MKESLTILKKELLEIFRDRSTLLILLIPILIFPVFNIGMNFINKDSVKKLELCVDYDSEEAYEIFNQYLTTTEKYDINVINSDTPKGLLKNGDIDCLICIKDNSFDFVYNSNSYDSLSLTAKIGEDFQQFYNVFLNQSYEDVFQINLKDENDNFADASDTMSGIFVPIVLVMMIFQSTSSFANDIFAGEKERKTVELLLLTGVKRKVIYCGKLFTLLIMSTINLIFSLLSYFITFIFSESGLKQFKFMQNGIALTNISGIILTLLLLSVIAAFLSLTVSLMSKNMKNSQVMNEIILAVPTVTAVLIGLGVIKRGLPILNYIPLFNLIVGLNNAFCGNFYIFDIIALLVTNGAFIAIIMLIGIKYIKTERILE